MRRPAAVAVLACGLLGLAPAAHAGSFRISQCNAVDQGGPIPKGVQADAWQVANGWAVSSCGTHGGRLRFDTFNRRLAHESTLVARFSVPGSMPGTSLRTAWLDWHLLAQAPSDNPAYLDLKAAGTVLLDVPAGRGSVAGAADRFSVPGGARELRFTTWCSPVNGPGWCNWHSAPLELRGLTVELEESGEPGASAAGPLLAGGERSGTEPLSVEAADGDSGVRRVTVSLDGATAGELAAECRDDRLPPCPPALRGIVDVDTALVPDGPARLRLSVQDAAGNRRSADLGVVAIRNQRATDGAAAAPLGGSPPATPFPPDPFAARGEVPAAGAAGGRVRAWLEPRRGVRRQAVVVAHGRRVRVRGRVADAAGRPVRDALLVALERVRGRRWRVVTGVRTRADGRFTSFSRVGPSRALRFVHQPPGASGNGIRSPLLRHAVRVPVSFRAEREGGGVRGRGRVGGGRVPRGGVLVELQRWRTGGWTRVGALRSGRDGRFAARLTAPPGVALRLRAVVPAQPALPFATGRSPAARVR